ncbi:MAG: MFS transporter [Gemmatimonadetes bacterium]|nr:MFS transporter [Gemmatimonadota bacterium]
MLKRSDYFLFTSAFVMDFCTGLVSFAVPLRALDMGASVVELGFIGTAGSLSFTLACTFTGKLADRFDRRRILAIASGLTALVFGMLFLAVNYWMLLAGTAMGWGLLALFWPSVQAMLAEGRSRTQLVKTLGTFNIFWTMGFMLGPLAGGYLYLVGPTVPFATGTIGMVLLTLAIAFLRFRPDISQEADPEEEPQERTREDTARFRWIAWTANFTAFFMIGMLNNQFPKLATELLIRADTLGILLAIPRVLQMAVFLIARYTTWWQFRLRPLVLPQIAAVIGMVVVATQDATVVLAFAFGTVGLLVGAAFSASQFYSFFQEERKGEKGARNEMIVGMGMVSGPLVGGLLAQLIGLRMPYVLCCLVLIVGMIVEYRWYRKRTQGVRTGD